MAKERGEAVGVKSEVERIPVKRSRSKNRREHGKIAGVVTVPKNILKRARLDELCKLVTDGTHDSPELQSEGVPFIKGKHISGGFIDFANCDYITEADHQKAIARSKPECGDILFSNIGSVGDTVYVDTDCEFSIKNVALFKPDPAKIDSRYLYYVVMGPKFRPELLAKRSGAAQPFFSLDMLRTHEVEYHPDCHVQRKIAGILGAYDDLIENNTRRIKILEEMVQAIYREWFVNFKFPATKKAGKLGHEKVKLVHSPLGKIPQGWEVRKLGEIADIQWGDTSTTKASYVEDGFDAYSASGLDGKLDHYDFDQEGIVLSAIGANCGQTWFVQGKWSCIKNTIRFWASLDNASTAFLYFATRGQDFWPRRGAAQPFISQGDALKIQVIVPNRKLMDIFTELASNVLKAIRVLELKNTNLRRTRDLLLPKLISGEVSVDKMDIKTEPAPC